MLELLTSSYDPFVSDLAILPMLSYMSWVSCSKGIHVGLCYFSRCSGERSRNAIICSVFHLELGEIYITLSLAWDSV